MNFLTSISAGVPLTYYHPYKDSNISEKNLTFSFLEISFSEFKEYSYRKNGFMPYITLTEIFNVEYTQKINSKLHVRAINSEDVCRITGFSEMAYGNSMNLTDMKYDKLFINDTNYWLGTAYNDSALWSVRSSRKCV